MKKLITLIFLAVAFSGYSQDDIDWEKYKIKVAWKTTISNVQYLNTDTFTVVVAPIDDDPGTFPLRYGNFLMDVRGLRYEIIDTTSAPTLTVVDILNANYAPFQGEPGFVYLSAGNGGSPSLPTVNFEQLNPDALQYGYGVDMNILWDGMDSLVPYRGAIRDVDLNTFGIKVGFFSNDTTYVPTGLEQKGTSYWDNDNNTMSTVMGNGVIYQWAKEAYIDGQNDTGVEIPNGTPVMYAGSIGNSGNFRIQLGIASSTSPAFLFIGVTTEPIQDGEVGKITTRGKARGIQTDGGNYGEVWSAGDIVYESGTTAGYLTNVAPQAPIPAIPVALVISAHATNGTLEVRPTFPQKLTELSDVNGTPLVTTGQFPVWDNVNKYFDFNFNINDYSSIEADSVTIATGIGSPTVNQLQLYMDNIGSSGFFLGGELSDGGAGTLDVAAGSGFIRTTNDENAEIQSFKWSASAGIAVTDNTTQYAYVDDTGVISLSTNEFLEAPDLIQIGVVTKEGGVVDHTFGLGVRLQESIGNAGRFIRRVHGISRDKRKGGLIFGQSGDANRDISITAGSLWWGRTEYPIPSFNTSGSDVFNTYSASGLEDALATAWPNLQYDNGGTLTNLGNNKWANLFFFIEPDGHIDMVYGRAQFNSEAIADFEGVPSTSLPSRISETSILAARFTFKKSSNTATISSAFEQLFANAGVTSHPDLAVLDFASSGHTGFEPTISTGTTLQYWRGDKTFQTLNTSIVPELTNLYYTEVRVSANSSVAANTASRHDAATLSGAYDYITLSGQDIIRGQVDYDTDISNTPTIINNHSGLSELDYASAGHTGFAASTDLTDGSINIVGNTLSAGFTAGSVIFSNGTNLVEDNSNFRFDDVNNKLIVGSNTPSPLSGTTLALTSTGNSRAGFTGGNANEVILDFGDTDDFDIGGILYNNPNNSLGFKTNNSIRYTIDNAGDHEFYAGDITTTGTATVAKLISGNGSVLGAAAGTSLIATNTANSRVAITSGNANASVIDFGDINDTDIGGIQYNHSDNSMDFKTNTSTKVTIASDGDLTGTGTFTHAAPTLSTESALLDDIEGGTRNADFATLDVTGAISQTANLGGVWSTVLTNSASGGGALKLQANDGAGAIFNVYNYADTQHFGVYADGDIKMNSIPSATKTNVLYYDTSSKEVSYGAAPSGGGNVSNVGTPVDGQVTVWNSATTVAGYTGMRFNKSNTSPALNLYASSVSGESSINFFDELSASKFALGYDNSTNEATIISSEPLNLYSGLNQVQLNSTEFDIVGDLNVGGYFKDASGDVGTSGQILSSTVTGTNWIDNTSGLWTDGGTFVYPTNGETVRSSSSAPAFELYDSDSDDFKISGDGNFVSIINVTTAQGLFNLSNTGVIDLPAYGGGAVTGTAAYNLEVTSGGLVIETAAGSDFRKKENFRLLNNSLDKIISLNTYAFDWKKDIPKQARETAMNIEIQSDLNERESAGVIAQEIQKIIPEAVKQYNNGYYKVDYEVIVPHLIEAIKEQQKQIYELKILIN